MTIETFDIAGVDVTGFGGQFNGRQITRDFSGRLYALFEHSTNHTARVFFSDDDGETWTLNSWEQTIGSSLSDPSHSQLVINRSDNVPLLFRLNSALTQIVMFRRNASTETWDNHGAIWGASASVNSRLRFAYVIPDYAFAVVIGSPPILAPWLNFYYHRSDPQPDLILFQNTDFHGEEVVISDTDIDPTLPFIPITGLSSVQQVVYWKRGVATKNLIYRIRSGDVDEVGSWNSQGNVLDGQSANPFLMDFIQSQATSLHRVLWQDLTSGDVFISTRGSDTNWTAQKMVDIDGADVPGPPGVSGQNRLTEDRDGTLYAQIMRSGANSLRVWSKRNLNNFWTPEVADRAYLFADVTNTIYDPTAVPSGLTTPIQVPAKGMWGTFYESSSKTFFFFRTGNAIFTPEPEPPYECLPEPTRSSVVLTGEGSSAGALPQETPDLVYRQTGEWHTEKARFESGHVARVSRFPDKRRRMVVRFEALSEPERDDLADFLDARQNANEAFTFTLPDTLATVTAVAVPNTIEWIKRAPGVYAVEFEVEELIV